MMGSMLKYILYSVKHAFCIYSKYIAVNVQNMLETLILYRKTVYKGSQKQLVFELMHCKLLLLKCNTNISI